jgi:hypothetical protein
MLPTLLWAGLAMLFSRQPATVDCDSKALENQLNELYRKDQDERKEHSQSCP